MFLDEAIIDVTGGKGGDGCVAWRREKYVPMGGPSGGNGGVGGDVIIRADDNTDTLSDFASRKKFEAEKGQYGSGSQRAGKDGENLVLLVPPGTIIREMTTGDDGAERVEIIGDLTQHGEELLVAHGGRGGYGNAHFKSSVRQRPDFAELGEPGEKRRIKLELKLVADVGIIGYPSVGKSTLISVISAAKPKIADYPFTTLVPNLGVVNVDTRSYVVCDVPGLIEGASEGKGLGHTFLKHIERVGVLLHVLDVSRAFDTSVSPDATLNPELLLEDYMAIRRELEAYSPTLARKRELVILNKVDLIPDEVTRLRHALETGGVQVFTSISAATTLGTEDLTKKLLPIVLEERERRHAYAEDETAAKKKEVPVLRPHLGSDDSMGAYRIEKKSDGSVMIRGKRLEQFTQMTDFSNTGAVNRFHDVLDKIGLRKAIKKLQLAEGTAVWIGKTRVEGYL